MVKSFCFGHETWTKLNKRKTSTILGQEVAERVLEDGPYGAIGDYIGPKGTIRNHKGPYWSIGHNTGPYRSIKTIQDHRVS